jgi:hypothetical protein
LILILNSMFQLPIKEVLRLSKNKHFYGNLQFILKEVLRSATAVLKETFIRGFK